MAITWPFHFNILMWKVPPIVFADKVPDNNHIESFISSTLKGKFFSIISLPNALKRIGFATSTAIFSLDITSPPRIKTVLLPSSIQYWPIIFSFVLSPKNK